MTPAQFTRSVRSLNRLRQIAQVLTRHGFGYIVAQINLAGYVPVWMLRKKGAVRTVEESGAALGKRLARVCAEIGPTFIKLGQMVSTRRDILPGDVADGLRSLQDEVPPFDTSQAMEVIAKDLGQPVDACYTWISEQPIASASIGQVYRARGLEKEDLVVKVRRPDIENVIRLDMQLLHWMAESVERLMPELRIYRPTMIVDELDQMLTRELDYINEAATTARFADAFREDTGIRIPEVHWELTGPRVLTLQAIQGRNVLSLLNGAGSSGGGIDRPLVARRLAECYL
ncbi:MAG: ABC1 kinase family protein, partial [Phycisphaerae bacterium]